MRHHKFLRLSLQGLILDIIDDAIDPLDGFAPSEMSSPVIDGGKSRVGHANPRAPHGTNSSKPRVLTAAVPMRIPLFTNSERVSKGIMFLLSVMHAALGAEDVVKRGGERILHTTHFRTLSLRICQSQQ